MKIPGTGSGKHRADDEGLGSGPPPPKSVQVMATLSLFLIAGVTTFAISWASIVKDDGSATALLGTLATAAIAALVVLSGGRHSE